MRILLVEDEPDLAAPLIELLRRERYDVVWARAAGAAYETLQARDFDLAVLDVMLPEGEDAGFELARHLRDVRFPGQILFLTARDSVEDRVHGLDAGGDDYLVKPFSLQEFLARVRALLRRFTETRNTVLERGSLRVEFTSRRVFWQEREVGLSVREFAMIEHFAHYPDRVFSVDELRERFFPEAGSGQQAVRVYVRQLRTKIAEVAIITVPGGYRLGSA